MICAECSDKGKPVDMEHVEGEEVYHDPSAYNGAGFRKTCAYYCPVCGSESDCDGHMQEDLEQE